MTAPETSSAAQVVRVERLLPAPPDAVFRAFTDPALLRRWMSPVGHAEASVDARVGGALHIAMIDGDVRIEHTGEILELDRPRRMRFTWVSAYTGAAGSVVTVTLLPDGDQTRLTLLHEQLPVGVVDPHRSGWKAMVERLVGVLAEMSGQEVVM